MVSSSLITSTCSLPAAWVRFRGQIVPLAAVHTVACRQPVSHRSRSSSTAGRVEARALTMAAVPSADTTARTVIVR